MGQEARLARRRRQGKAGLACGPWGPAHDAAHCDRMGVGLALACEAACCEKMEAPAAGAAYSGETVRVLDCGAALALVLNWEVQNAAAVRHGEEAVA